MASGEGMREETRDRGRHGNDSFRGNVPSGLLVVVKRAGGWERAERVPAISHMAEMCPAAEPVFTAKVSREEGGVNL